MRRSIALLASGVIVAAAFGGPALSQGTPQTLFSMNVDPASLATGHLAGATKESLGNLSEFKYSN